MRGRGVGQHRGAEAGLARQQPLVLQRAQGLAHGMAADAEPVAQLIFRREFGAHGKFAGGDFGGERLAQFHIARQRSLGPSVNDRTN